MTDLTDDIFEQLRSPHVRNVDNEWLGPLGAIGHIDEVNGKAAAEVPGFVATRGELFQLAKHWAGIAIEIEFFWFLYQQVGSEGMRLNPFAWRRVNRIAEFLGHEAVERAVTQARRKIEKTASPRYWKVFVSGTDEERQVVQTEIQKELQGTEEEELPKHE